MPFKTIYTEDPNYIVGLDPIWMNEPYLTEERWRAMKGQTEILEKISTDEGVDVSVKAK